MIFFVHFGKKKFILDLENKSIQLNSEVKNELN